jgi:transcriptional regulator with XRE-family HTH domain
MTADQIILLKTRLKANRWNLTHLAKQAGVSQSHLSQLINNKATCRHPVAFTIAVIASQMTGFKYTADDFISPTTTNTEN